MKKVIIYPEKEGKENMYINNLYNTIKKNYEVIGYDEAKNSIKLFLADVYHFNWIENTQGKMIKLKYAKKRFLINILKILHKKIIWTIHNKVPHDTIKKDETLKFMKFMAEKSDKIHILSKDTMQNDFLGQYKEKIVYIPHGDYIGNYRDSQVDIYKRYNINTNKKIILFLGQIKEYKNIELLIRSFIESNLQLSGYILLICGKCGDEKYKEKLKNMSNESIYFDFNFIKNEEMKSYLDCAEILVAPYNKESSLNSGTLWMCMSYKKTMILPLIGCIKDIKNYNEFLYVYDYKDFNDHYDNLFKTMVRIKNDIEKDKNILKNKGEMAYNYILKNQTWKVWKKEWINLYMF